MKHFLGSLLIIACVAACSHKTNKPIVETKEASYKWGYEYYPPNLDSLNLISYSPGIAYDKNCFPSDYIDESKVNFISILVCNRWGEVFFKTTDLKSSWICNDDKNETFSPGTYVYKLEYTLRSNPSDTIKNNLGTIYIKEITE